MAKSNNSDETHKRAPVRDFFAPSLRVAGSVLHRIKGADAVFRFFDHLLSTLKKIASGTMQICSRGCHRGDHIVKIWDVETITCKCTLAYDNPIVCVAFSPDGSTIAAGEGSSQDSIATIFDIRLYDAKTGAEWNCSDAAWLIQSLAVHWKKVRIATAWAVMKSLGCVFQQTRMGEPLLVPTFDSFRHP